jgi:hypothetical protein
VMLTFASTTTAGQDRGAEAGWLQMRDVITLHTGMGAYAYVDQSKLVNRRSLSCVHGVMQYQWVSSPAFPVILADLGENGGENAANPLNRLDYTLPTPTIRRLCASAGRLGAPPGAGLGPRGPNPPPKIQKSPVISATCAVVRPKPTPDARSAARTAAMTAGQGYALRGAA